MTESRPKVVVAMSGGVDSSLAACLLCEQGYEATGLFMAPASTTRPPTPSSPTAIAAAVRRRCL